MIPSLDLWFLAVYITVFLVASYRSGEFQWLWGSVLLWVGFSAAGLRLLPGLWGLTHIAPLYIPHFYIALAALFFFVNHWRRSPDKKIWYAVEADSFISLFAVSSILMSVVSFFLLLIIYSRFPSGITPYVLPAFVQMYALEPGGWFVMQGVVMAIFYLHRTMILKEPANYFSSRQLQLGFLLALIFQTAYIVWILLGFRYS
ncbi:hypothetical protein [Neisseria montereyensis]|uniref:Integral membrane protein n=1 Tax=Neisseria montereyensis TaxID=2973938 RepID=A0ABT2FCN1_9NEIS|nr:hypothetical protein [Neisseria montereyensis]MCS4533705.1 hypothetical protein [Neisseria montereyensis]